MGSSGIQLVRGPDFVEFSFSPTDMSERSEEISLSPLESFLEINTEMQNGAKCD